MKISNIFARQIIDSRGNPTVEAEVWTDQGFMGRASVPSGASTGIHEAVELRDGGDKYNGNGVLNAVRNVNNEIYDALKGVNVDDQFKIDQIMIDLDGTENKSRLGANSILAVSLASAKAAANTRKIPLYKQINDIAHNPKMSLPMPMMNFLNGGRHANNSADFQEYMVIPISAKTYSDAIKIGVEIFQNLKKIINKQGLSTAVGDEGGFALPVTSLNTEPLDLLIYASQESGYEPGKDVAFALDIAASEFYNKQFYELKKEGRQLDSNEMIDYINLITTKYPVLSVEDGLAEDDWDSWSIMNNRLGSIQLVGDDLLVTNTERLKKAIAQNAANAILIKPNQIGTLTETINCIKLAQENNWNTIVSHRSGETEDVSIAHIAVGTGAGQIKTGSLSRSERTSKHNELMRIEQREISLSLSRIFK